MPAASHNQRIVDILRQLESIKRQLKELLEK